MEARSIPRRDRYDVVVIGSGLGGLSAAAFLASSGRTALVVERLPRPGGYAASFERGDYVFDPAIHVIAQGEGLLLTKLLAYLGVADQCRLRPTGSFFEARFPDLRFRAPVGAEEYVAAHVECFGGDADAGVRRLLELSEQLHREVHQLPPSLSLRELEDAVKRFPTLFEYRNATLAQVLDECMTDPRLKAAVSAFWPYLGLPPAKLSFFTCTTPLVNLTREGTFQCEGSTQRLVDALVAGVERHGGELVLDNGAVKVAVDDGRVAGVVLADGTQVQAPVVVSSADARHTFHDLVGAEHTPPAFMRRLGRMRPSVSAVVIFAAMKGLDRSLAHQTFVHRHWSHEENYNDVLEGRPGGVWLSLPTLRDDTLAPPGEDLLIFTAMARHDAVRTPAERDRFVEEVLDSYADVVPDLRDGLTFLETATPRTLARYAGNRDGAIYGWENSPAQAGSRRMHHRTPIGGLFLCGHWTQPGSGAFRVVFSGIETTLNVLGAGYADQFLRDLGLLA